MANRPPQHGRPGNLADAIYADLVRRIIQAEFRPGDRLTAERELAAKYDTNRNTLREAIRKLEHDGLVTVRQGQGVTIADWRTDGTLELLGAFMQHAPSPAERVQVLVDLLMARIRVLQMAVELAAERAMPGHVARLRDIAQRQVAAFEAGDREAMMRGEIDLIEAVVDATDSLTVRWSANTLLGVHRAMLERARGLFIFEPTFPTFVRDLAEAIAARESETAAALIGDYYRRTDARLMELFETLLPELRGSGSGASKGGDDDGPDDD